MNTQRVTVSLPSDLLRDVRAAVAAGEAESLSAYVADALRIKRARDRGLAELERVLPGGRPPQEVLDQVRRDLGVARR